MADNNPQAGQGRPLPKKEADLFKNVVKHYELKQFKKAIKQAETILKKYPNHGETLAMKGLILNSMGKKDEAHSLVKMGLMNDMRSHVCWHVYGLLHRSNRDYNEAIKAYKQALRIDVDNLQILRDLSMLQVQMRDLDGFAVTRHNILTLKSNGKINWLAFALAKHLTGDLRGAISVIDIYLGTLAEDAPERTRGFEASELAMYKNQILAEIPDNYQEALDHLAECEQIVVDRTSWITSKCKYQLRLGKFTDAKTTTMEMFERGMTENFKVHNMYMCAVLELDETTCEEAFELPGTRTLATHFPLTAEQKKIILEGYRTELFPLYEKSHAMQRVCMNLVEEDRFISSLDVFMRKQLVKGVPSLCNELSTFLLTEKNGRIVLETDPALVKKHATFKLIVGLVDGYLSCLTEKSKLLPGDESNEPPSTFLWTWYLRAGLHEMAAEYVEGIAFLDKCLEHTPTAVDVYELKARLLKKAGDIDAAVECIDKGRDLDRQDRYINNQTTRYMLQAGKEEEASNRISMFTKHEGNPEQNLYDMQCSWYELELAACLYRKEEWGRSLKKYSAIIKHFDDFNEDQFDFHGYCIRKVTLRAYTAVLKFEDSMFNEDYYCTAAGGIIKLYLHLHDNPSLTEEEKEPDYSKMTAAEKKKAKAIARKKRNQAEKKAAQEKKKEEDDEKDGKKKKKHVLDEDPEGAELLKKNPLEEASKFSSILAKYSPKRIETWAHQFDVSIRRKKNLLALQALFKLKNLDPDAPEYLTRLVYFGTTMGSFTDESAVVKDVIKTEMDKLLNGKSLEAYVSDTAASAKNGSTSLPRRIGIALSLFRSNPKATEEAASIILDGGVDTEGVSVETCKSASDALTKINAQSAKKEWTSIVKAKFPLLKDFA